jgi:hypothetical protein
MHARPRAFTMRIVAGSGGGARVGGFLRKSILVHTLPRRPMAPSRSRCKQIELTAFQRSPWVAGPVTCWYAGHLNNIKCWISYTQTTPRSTKF